MKRIFTWLLDYIFPAVLTYAALSGAYWWGVSHGRDKAVDEILCLLAIQTEGPPPSPFCAKYYKPKTGVDA